MQSIPPATARALPRVRQMDAPSTTITSFPLKTKRFCPPLLGNFLTPPVREEARLLQISAQAEGRLKLVHSLVWISGCHPSVSSVASPTLASP